MLGILLPVVVLKLILKTPADWGQSSKFMNTSPCEREWRNADGGIQYKTPIVHVASEWRPIITTYNQPDIQTQTAFRQCSCSSLSSTWPVAVGKMYWRGYPYPTMTGRKRFSRRVSVRPATCTRRSCIKLSACAYRDGWRRNREYILSLATCVLPWPSTWQIWFLDRSLSVCA